MMQTTTITDLADSGHFSLEEAERIANKMIANGVRVPERFALALQAEPPPDPGRAERMLELLPRITSPERLLPLLDRILPSSSSRIRSKAWGLYATASADIGWAMERLEDPDPRVAANVVEALWRAKPTEELRQFFWKAANLDRNRVAGNGLVGLYNYGDPRATELILKMTEDELAEFRASATWVIGRVYYREGVFRLNELLQDPSEKVRRNAERSLRRILARYPYAA